MPSNNRKDNQYFGKYRECCVVANLNNSEVEFNENYSFSSEEQKTLYEEGKMIADFQENIQQFIWEIILLPNQEIFFQIMVKLLKLKE